MRYFKTFLRNKRGETIAETLVAILIAGISVAMLTAMISVSAGITQKSTDSFSSYYSGNNAVAGKNSSAMADGTGSVSITAEGLTYTLGSGSMEVNYYTNDQAVHNPVVRYTLSGTSGSAD